MRFSVFTHVDHVKSGKLFFAYAPYVREMNLWFKEVDEVEIVAPIFKARVGEVIQGESYSHSRLQFTSVPSINFSSFMAIAKSTIKLPEICLEIYKAMKRADHIHLRCPGNLGLIACVLQIFFPKKCKTAKYAGNWDPAAKQPWSYKLQKRILSNSFLTRNMTVLVYGNWKNQPKNIQSFFTASFKAGDREKIIKQYNPPYRFLFVGNLVPGKQPLFAVKLVEALNKNNIDAELDVYGEGEIGKFIEAAAKNKSYIRLHGIHPLGTLKHVYKGAHFLVLASKSEGWPKAVAEAMFFGCIPISTAVSCVPWMLGEGRRGVLIPERGNEQRPKGIVGGEDQEVLEAAAEKIKDLINSPIELNKMSIAAQEWSQNYTLERFDEAIRKIIKFDNKANEKSFSPER